jgi:hypothetical protein
MLFGIVMSSFMSALTTTTLTFPSVIFYLKIFIKITITGKKRLFEGSKYEDV